MVLGMPTIARGAPSLAHLLGDGMRSALCPVAAHAEEDVDVVGLEVVDHVDRVAAAARCAQHRAAHVVDVVDAIRGEHDRLEALVRVEPLVALADADDSGHTIVVGELVEARANGVVETGRETTAGHEGGGRLCGVEEDALARAGLLEGQLLAR